MSAAQIFFCHARHLSVLTGGSTEKMESVKNNRRWMWKQQKYICEEVKSYLHLKEYKDNATLQAI